MMNLLFGTTLSGHVPHFPANSQLIPQAELSRCNKNVLPKRARHLGIKLKF
jgi:hypothetical protein